MTRPDEPSFPFPVFSWPRRLWERINLLLSGDPSGRGAWERATLSTGQAVELARARIPPDVRDLPRPERGHETEGGWQWIEALRSSAGWSFTEPQCLAWIQALPKGSAGQAWRNRALWAGVEKARPNVVAAALQSGADFRDTGSDAIGWAKGQSMMGMALRMGNTPERDAAQVVGLLAEAGDSIDEGVRRTPTVRAFSSQSLRQFHAWGARFDDPVVATKWWASVLSHPVLDKPVRVRNGLFDPNDPRLSVFTRDDARRTASCLPVLGADPNERNGKGQTPLQVFLLSHRCKPGEGDTESEQQEGVRLWLDTLIRGGADPAIAPFNGATTLHAALGAPYGAALSWATVERLREAHPEAFDTQDRDGHTPLSLMRATLGTREEWEGQHAATRAMVARLEATVLAEDLDEALPVDAPVRARLRL